LRAGLSQEEPLAVRTMQLWGGIECTLNRVGERFFCQLTTSGHAGRIDDLDRFAALGIRVLRYPLLWERLAPDGLEHARWGWADERLQRLRSLGIAPIAGLVHHGSGPAWTSLADESFAPGLERYAAAIARRYPWIESYTPVNEPLTTARFSGLYGHWYPHGRDERAFGRVLLNQCRATVLAMRAVRAVNSEARLVQTDDLSRTWSTPAMAYQADFQNELRWLAWDLLYGRVGRQHPLWWWLTHDCGCGERELLWFAENPCPPDIVGLNYYVTSERYLDERIEHFPECTHGGNGRDRYADTEAVRAIAQPPDIAGRIFEAWERYRLPLAITEAHLDAGREDQLRWIRDIWNAALAARRQGADVRAVTLWALLGAFDWNSLVTRSSGYYETGVFDLRSDPPRATALAALACDLARGNTPSHPVLDGEGWWRRPQRLQHAPAVLRSVPLPRELESDPDSQRPVLIAGATGTLGRAFARICRARGIAHRALTRTQLDIANGRSVEDVMQRWRPWAVINAAGYVRVDDAEADASRCFRENTTGPQLLAQACADLGVRFLTFSSDLVFDGTQDRGYVEADTPAPLNVYGHSKARAEQFVLERNPQALIVRTSAFFGPWDEHNFISLALRALARGQPFTAASDLVVSPTYVPDLVHTSLDLLIDAQSGIWHLANDCALSWLELAARAAHAAGIETKRLESRHSSELHLPAQRPAYSALSSNRGRIMPSLDDALRRYCEHAERPRLEGEFVTGRASPTESVEAKK
jgi:dTDP-4-dehydrorhamnose reductase